MLRRRMTDERIQPADVIAGGFAALVEGLRDDVREDIRDLRTEVGKSEERVTAQVEAVAVAQRETRTLIEDYAKGHGQEHEDEFDKRQATHSTFYDFMHRFELQQARRDGALGAARFSVELLSKNAPRLIAIIAALAGAIGVASGSINIEIGK